MDWDGFGGGLELSDRSELTDTEVVAQVIYSPGRMDCLASPAASLTTAFEACYSALAGKGVGTFETLRIVQDLPSDSTTVRMRLKPEQADELQLTFLARGTLTILGWLATASPQLPDLARAIQVLANGTLPEGIRAPAQADLIRAVAAIQELRTAIPNAESIKVVMHRGAADFDLSAAELDLGSLLAKTLLRSPDGEMILIVEEPDYSRSGRWGLRHGSQRLEAKCDSGAIVDAFYRRAIDIRPGDALRCRVRIDRSYDSDNELLSEDLSIVEIVGIVSDETGKLPAIIEAQPATEFRRGNEDGNVIELEGDFGILTLREIPIN